MAARHAYRVAEGGAAKLAEARERAVYVEPAGVTVEAAAKLARVSAETIMRAWKIGDLAPVEVREDARPTFCAEAVKTWARAKRLIV
jgi:hypothetical protein